MKFIKNTVRYRSTQNLVELFLLDFEIKPLTDFEELKTLDFRDDGSDPLGVHNFAQVRAQSYGRNKLSVI